MWTDDTTSRENKVYEASPEAQICSWALIGLEHTTLPLYIVDVSCLRVPIKFREQQTIHDNLSLFYNKTSAVLILNGVAGNHCILDNIESVN